VYRGLTWVVFGVFAASLAAGCGGDDGGGDSSATAWADDVCSAITTWTDSITSTTDSLKGGNLNEDALKSAVDDLASATSDFVDDVRGLGPPDTEGGQQAKESLDQLADDADENLSTVQKAVDDVSGPSGIVAAITAISGAVSTMGQQLSSTFSELEQLDPGGELETAFNEADSCDQLQSGG
jgi:hypothetical protein